MQIRKCVFVHVFLDSMNAIFNHYYWPRNRAGMLQKYDKNKNKITTKKNLKYVIHIKNVFRYKKNDASVTCNVFIQTDTPTIRET